MPFFYAIDAMVLLSSEQIELEGCACTQVKALEERNGLIYPDNRDVQRALHPPMIGGGPGPRGARPQAPKKEKKKEKRKKKEKEKEKREGRKRRERKE